MSILKMPSLGASMEAGTLMEWKVKEGDSVKKDQVIAEIESSKGVIAIEVFEDGVIDKLLVEPGTECPIGAPIALILNKNETSESLQKELKILREDYTEELKKENEDKKEPIKEPKVSQTIPADEIKISPAARKKAKELNIDLTTLIADVKGKIGVNEVEAAATSKDNMKRPEGMRQAIATAMSRSNTEIPHYYLSTTINMTPALEWLEKKNNKASIKERILPAALIIYAIVKALQIVPQLNGFWQDNKLQISEEINPGIAIALRQGGLVTPALIRAQDMNMDQIMPALHDLITRTRSGKLRSSELTKQTIVITNLGDLGVDLVYGIIYPPQVALIGIGRIIEAPWVEENRLVIRKVMQVTLSGDHRATDGRTGAIFLDKLDQILQKPQELS